jgi:hypothetical protein
MIARFIFTLGLSLLSSVIVAQNISLSFDDIQVDPSDSTLSFAIMMSASAPGTYHTGGNIYVTYSTASFGANAASNGRVTLSRAASSLTPNSYTLNVVDVFSGSTLNIDWSNLSVLFGFPSGYLEVPTTPDTLVRVTMKYINPSQAVNIAFDQSTTNGKTLWFDGVNPGTIVPYNSPHTYSSALIIPPTTLPVEWISFTADRLDSRNIQLRWETDNEVNNDYFVVQRSVDAEFFEDIGEVDGSGNTEEPKTYMFLDNNYQANINYYRLKQVDFNGTFSFSNIVEVRFEGKEDFLAFHVFPSPVRDYLNVQALGKMNNSYQVKIFDQTGRQVYEDFIDKDHHMRRLDVRNWVEGIYNYEIIGGLEIVKTGRILKL